LKPPKTKKQKTSSDGKKQSTIPSTDDVWFDIPTRVKNKLISQINRCFIENDKNAELAYSLQEELDDIIYPSMTTSCRILERLEMNDLLYQAESEVNDAGQGDEKEGGNPSTEDAVKLKQKQAIMRYVADMTRLVQKAIKVFNMLNSSNNGSIDRDDIYRAIRELDSTTTGETTEDQNDPDNKYDYIFSMMTDLIPIQVPRDDGSHEVQRQRSITMNCDDIVRIAKLINL
jgi:hypothetical protein